MTAWVHTQLRAAAGTHDVAARFDGGVVVPQTQARPLQKMPRSKAYTTTRTWLKEDIPQFHRALPHRALRQFRLALAWKNKGLDVVRMPSGKASLN